MAKAAYWGVTDAEERKLGYRTGLDTPVVLTVNGEHCVMVESDLSLQQQMR